MSLMNVRALEEYIVRQGLLVVLKDSHHLCISSQRLATITISLSYNISSRHLTSNTPRSNTTTTTSTRISMRYSLFALAATAAFASADCQDDYKTCIAAGTPEVVCQCDLTTCSGEDAARIRSFCATATANLSAAPSSASATTTTTASIITGTPGFQPSGQPEITAAENSIPLGGTCSADAQCAGNAQCFGSTAGTIRTCGSFNAACSANEDCATNTCEGGLCRGFLPSESYLANTASRTSTSTSASTVTGTAGSQPSGQAPITAPENSIALGGTCSDTAQCAGNAQCYGTTAGTIRTCGSFNAGCSADADCATNTCQEGICSGFLPSESYLANTASRTTTSSSSSSTSSSSSSSATTTAAPETSTAIVTATPEQSSATSITTSVVAPSSTAGSDPATLTSVVVVPGASNTAGSSSDAASATTAADPNTYTGAASSVGYGFAAVAFGLAAWAL